MMNLLECKYYLWQHIFIFLQRFCQLKKFDAPRLLFTHCQFDNISHKKSLPAKPQYLCQAFSSTWDDTVFSCQYFFHNLLLRWKRNIFLWCIRKNCKEFNIPSVSILLYNITRTNTIIMFDRDHYHWHTIILSLWHKCRKLKNDIFVRCHFFLLFSFSSCIFVDAIVVEYYGSRDLWRVLQQIGQLVVGNSPKAVCQCWINFCIENTFTKSPIWNLM